MKQHITIEQLKESGVKVIDELRKWWKPKAGDLYFDNRFGVVGVMNPSERFEKEILDLEVWPLLSIGQMIEFINKDKIKIVNMDGQGVISWGVYFGVEFYNKVIRGKSWDYDKYFVSKSGELVDTLWEVVKYILNDKNEKNNP